MQADPSPARRRRGSRRGRQGARGDRRPNPDLGTRFPPLNRRRSVFHDQAREEVSRRSRLASLLAPGPSCRRLPCRSRRGRAARGTATGGRGRGRAAGATPTGPSCSMTADAPPGTVCALPHAEGPRSGPARPPRTLPPPPAPHIPKILTSRTASIPQDPAAARGRALNSSDPQMPGGVCVSCALNTKVAPGGPSVEAGLRAPPVRGDAPGTRGSRASRGL